MIFVLAGRMERKQYGLELYRAGFAPRLLLSVGRFEVSKMRALELEGIDEMIAERDRIAPDERHFFYEMSAASGVRVERPKLCRWNTYGEILGLRDYLENNPARKILFVSTDVHLCRIALTVDHVFRGVPIEASYCPVPAAASSVHAEEWWSRAKDRSYVFKESVKLAAYPAVLKLRIW